MTAHQITDEATLREVLDRLLDKAPIARLQAVAAYLQVADVAQGDAEDTQVPVPARLLGDNIEEVHAELARRRSTGGYRDAKEVHAELMKEFSS